jgi:hypothetical protein
MPEGTSEHMCTAEFNFIKIEDKEKMLRIAG